MTYGSAEIIDDPMDKVVELNSPQPIAKIDLPDGSSVYGTEKAVEKIR